MKANSTYNYDFRLIVRNALISRELPQNQFAEAHGIIKSNISGRTSKKKLILIQKEISQTMSRLIKITETGMMENLDRSPHPSKSKIEDPEEVHAQKVLDKFEVKISVMDT